MLNKDNTEKRRLILVIDVAAEHSGAVTILNQFISEFENDLDNDYIVVLSTLKYTDSSNVKYLNYEWVKKSHFHRLFFDSFVVKKLVNTYHPYKLLSLQNNAFKIGKTFQEVYFHNALPIADKRFSFFESKYLWLYQNLIGGKVRRSLKWANTIIVQANWIKASLREKWHVDDKKITVKKPIIEYNVEANHYCPQGLFYPANGSIYKNHYTLLSALVSLWKKYGGPELRLTGKMEELPANCQALLRDKESHIRFLGRLSKEEMITQYNSNILVFPSYIETIGLPLIEAKAVGSAIIASDNAYAHEAIGNYDKVDYFSTFDVQELSRLIEEKSVYYGIVQTKLGINEVSN